MAGDVTIVVCTQYHWWNRCHYSGMYGSIIGGTDDSGMYCSVIGGTDVTIAVCTAASLVVQMITIAVCTAASLVVQM